MPKFLGLNKTADVFILGLFFLAIIAAAGEEAASAAIDNSCQALEGSVERRIADEKAKDEERRRDAFFNRDDGKNIFEDCLGGIYRPAPFPRFPDVPGIEDAARELCQDARRRINSAYPTLSFGLDRLDGTNTVKPWNRDLNLDIWNALRDFWN
jgi:hypothetical protein